MSDPVWCGMSETASRAEEHEAERPNTDGGLMWSLRLGLSLEEEYIKTKLQFSLRGI